MQRTRGRSSRSRGPCGGCPSRPEIRVDAGIDAGDEVGGAYDPMIAKLIAHAPDRDAALDRLAAALDETVVEGVTTNLPFLRWLVAHPAFRAGDVTTAFLTGSRRSRRTPARRRPARGTMAGVSTCRTRARSRRSRSRKQRMAERAQVATAA